MAVTLRSEEVRRLTTSLDRIAAVAEPATFPGVALEASASVVRCDVATYNEVDPRGSLVVWWPEGVEHPADAEETLNRYVEEHPLIMENARTGDGSPRAISDFLTPQEFRKRNLYRLIFGPMGLADQLAIGLLAPRPLIIGIALNRERRGFSERDRLLANLIRPFLVQAHRSVRLAATLEAASALALDNRAAAIVLPDGRIEPLGDAFPSWLPAVELFPAGRLDDSTADWVAGELARATLGDGLPRLSLPLVRVTSGRRWTLRYVTTRAGPVIVITRGHQSDADQRVVLRALGLTEREASVLQVLSQGANNREIATALDVSQSAVKRHLESIYRKLGVRNRSEATALAVDTLAAS